MTEKYRPKTRVVRFLLRGQFTVYLIDGLVTTKDGNRRNWNDVPNCTNWRGNNYGGKGNGEKEGDLERPIGRVILKKGLRSTKGTRGLRSCRVLRDKPRIRVRYIKVTLEVGLT